MSEIEALYAWIASSNVGESTVLAPATTLEAAGQQRRWVSNLYRPPGVTFRLVAFTERTVMEELPP